MNKTNFKIVFMGTPDFAVASLKKLHESNFNIVGVITSTDKPAGRGQKIQESSVKRYAIENNMNILQPKNLKSEEFLKDLQLLEPDLIIVVAFRMLPDLIWQMPKNGTINLHASLLPQYRGAAPINWAIINGEKETGITTFFIKKEIDTGDIILQENISITNNMNAGELHDILMEKGAQLLAKTVDSIINGSNKNIKQEKNITEIDELKKAPKIFKQDCKIDWSNDNTDIHNLIRGLSPHPVAWTEILNNNNNKKLVIRIFESEKIDGDHNSIYGEIITDHKSYLYISANGGLISIKDIQLQGRKRMKVSEFLKGFNLKECKVS